MVEMTEMTRNIVTLSCEYKVGTQGKPWDETEKIRKGWE